MVGASSTKDTEEEKKGRLVGCCFKGSFKGTKKARIEKKARNLLRLELKLIPTLG